MMNALNEQKRKKKTVAQHVHNRIELLGNHTDTHKNRDLFSRRIYVPVLGIPYKGGQNGH